MLILTRRQSERLVINDNIIVEVIEIRGNQVRLGVTAPRDIDVHREEVHQRIQQDKATA